MPKILIISGVILIFIGVLWHFSVFKYIPLGRLPGDIVIENENSKVITRLPDTLFSPEQDWELNGEVNNVVFPTGTALFGDTLYIYYGAADEQIACASLSLSSLLKELLTNKNNYEK